MVGGLNPPSLSPFFHLCRNNLKFLLSLAVFTSKNPLLYYIQTVRELRAVQIFTSFAPFMMTGGILPPVFLASSVVNNNGNSSILHLPCFFLSNGHLLERYHSGHLLSYSYSYRFVAF